MPANTKSDAKDRIDFLWKVHGYTNDYIRFADSKAAFVVAIVGGLISICLSSHLYDHLRQSSFRDWPVRSWIGIIALAFLLCSFSSALLAIRPRLQTNEKKGMIFWVSVTRHKNDLVYAASANQLTSEELETNVSRHIYALAAICTRKYYWVNLSMIVGTLGGLMAGIAIFIAHTN
jgi:hypothetical protein